MRIPLFIFVVFSIVFSSIGHPTLSGEDLHRDAPTQQGTLLICGGGSLPESIKSKFVELAGGKNAKLFVVPSASERNDEKTLASKKKYWTEAGIGEVTILHTRDRAVADSAKFVEPLKNATAVWISGGQQSRLAKIYQGTATELAIKNVFQRGGIIGGTSAGAAIQTKVMIQSGNPDPVIATGWDLLPNAIVDQHFLRRNRFNRLLTAVKKNPDRVGIGISESTAILFNNGNCEVLGRSFVIAIDRRDKTKPLSIQSFRAGQSFPLKQRRPSK